MGDAFETPLWMDEDGQLYLEQQDWTDHTIIELPIMILVPEGDMT